ncbi:MAG TPA: oligosaccharide flippase family protein [Candidatus Eisenbacteria bacterium]|nr:oligosaccharide flippase family protein [Candidatus Eisenbacteria bacterium]
MNIFKTIISNTSAQVVSRIVSSGTGFLITILIARSFGIGGYSDLAKITAFVGLFYLGIDLGANAIFLQFEKHQQKFQELLWTRFFLATALFLFVCLLVFFLPYNAATTSGYSPFVKVGILLFSLSFFSRSVTYSTSALFQQQFSYKLATIASFANSITTLIFLSSFLYFHFSLEWVIAAYIVGSFAEAGISLFLAKQKIIPTIPSKEFIRNIFFATLPLTILLFLNLIYFRVDMVLLTFLQKSSDVGVYDFAYKFFDFLIALPLFLSNSLYPMLLAREKNSRISIKNISLYTSIFFSLGLFLIPFVWVLSPLLGFVKEDFTASIFPLRLLSLSLPIFFATNILQWIFITKKKQTFLVCVYAISLVINVLLNFIFIPQYSYVASAIITGLSELVILFAMITYILVKKI